MQKPIEPWIVERNESDELLLYKNGPSIKEQVLVFQGTSPETIDSLSPIAHTYGEAVLLSPSNNEGRPYFKLVIDGEPERIIAERLLPIEGTKNFRDLGGYETADGHHVKWGALYRSDHLSRLTDNGLAYLSQLNLKLVCDFRNADERSQHPNHLPGINPPEVTELDLYDETIETAKKRYQAGDYQDLDIHQIFTSAYQTYIIDFAYQYAKMFQELLDSSHVPILIHCVGGKDRTGIGAMLILLALGVPLPTAIYDYFLTNTYTASWREQTLKKVENPEMLRHLLMVFPDYLEAALDTAGQKYGSMDAYLQEALGITEEMRQQLRNTLLT